VWPVEIAPYHVVITVLRPDDEDSKRVSGDVYDTLRADGVEVLLDDRNERPGVKFNDAELIGVPVRITIGPRGIESGIAEVTERATGAGTEVPLGDIVDAVKSLLG
jgi:prolyl-tRNA synthetase